MLNVTGEILTEIETLKFSQMREKFVEKKAQYSCNEIFKQIKCCVLLRSTIADVSGRAQRGFKHL